MNVLKWREPEQSRRFDYGANLALEAETTDGPVRLWWKDDNFGGLDWMITTPGDPRQQLASTDNNQTWTQVERYLPRDQWPPQISAGNKGAKRRYVDPVVSAKIAEVEPAVKAEATLWD